MWKYFCHTVLANLFIIYRSFGSTGDVNILDRFINICKKLSLQAVESIHVTEPVGSGTLFPYFSFLKA